jgi:hypothetical protein
MELFIHWLVFEKSSSYSFSSSSRGKKLHWWWVVVSFHPNRVKSGEWRHFPKATPLPLYPSLFYPLLLWFLGPRNRELGGGGATGWNWCPALAAGRLEHFSFHRGGEVTQSNVQRLRAGSQPHAGRCPERCRCFPLCAWAADSEGRQLEGTRKGIYSFLCRWLLQAPHTAPGDEMREGLTQLEEFRYQWPDLKAQWGSMRSCRQESLSLYGSTLLFSQENLCCCTWKQYGKI